MITIVIPYLSKSKCIEKCKEYLFKNTKSEFELIEIVDCLDVYKAFNDGVKMAKNELVILINDDMFVSKDWDEMYLKYADGQTILTGYLVESGIIPVSTKNIEYNCGDTPQNFDYQKFESFINSIKDEIPEMVLDQKGWYMPILFYKSKFIEYPNEIKFPHPNDITLIDEILPKAGYKFAKIKSFVYHFQNASSRL
jgi:hypothetical protein